MCEDIWEKIGYKHCESVVGWLCTLWMVMMMCAIHKSVGRVGSIIIAFYVSMLYHFGLLMRKCKVHQQAVSRMSALF